MISIEQVWEKITWYEGKTFTQMRGKSFTYKIAGNAIALSTTNRNIPKSDIKKALDRLPLTDTVPLQSLQGPSYIFALLTDKRIVGNDNVE